MITILFPRGREVPGFFYFPVFSLYSPCLITKKPAGINPAGSSYWLTPTGYFGFRYQCMFDGAEWVAR